MPQQQPPTLAPTMPLTKRRIRRNLLAVTVIFLCNFTAYKGLQSLQSSVHPRLGPLAAAVCSLCGFASNLALPSLLLARLGHRGVMAAGGLAYTAWVLAQAHAGWWSLLPASALVGTLAGPVWTAQNAYVTRLATAYAGITGDSAEATLSRFFGIFWGIFHCSRVFGSVISTVVLKPAAVREGVGEGVLSKGQQQSHQDELVAHCGANDCPSDSFKKPHQAIDDRTLHTLVYIYTSLTFVAMFLVLFAFDEISSSSTTKSTEQNESKAIMLRTFRIFVDKRQLVMVPYLFGSGLFKAFIMADWPRSYISCFVGVKWVGLGVLPFGVFRSLSAYGGGLAPAYTGRRAIMILSIVIEISLLTFLLLWTIDPDDMTAVLVVSALQGVALGLAAPNLSALIATQFPGNMNAAYAAFNMIDILGHSVGYAYSNVLCTRVKIYVVLSLMVLGLCGYLMVEAKVCIYRRYKMRHV